VALEDVAVTLIEKFGRDVTLLSKSATPDDTAAPWDGAASEGTESTIKAAMTEFNNDQIDGTAVQKGDHLSYVAAKGNVAISTADTIVDGGKRWRIIAAQLLKPGTVEYLWILQLRA